MTAPPARYSTTSEEPHSELPPRARPKKLAILAMSSIAVTLALAPGTILAHALHHRLVEEDTVTIEFYYGAREKPWFEPYTVHAPGLDRPFQTGRVNSTGEVSFRPDRPGEWIVRVTTEDGHGTVARVNVSEDGISAAGDVHHGHIWRVVAGLGYLFGIFGLAMFFRRGRSRTPEEKASAHP